MSTHKHALVTSKVWWKLYFPSPAVSECLFTVIEIYQITKPCKQLKKTT